MRERPSPMPPTEVPSLTRTDARPPRRRPVWRIPLLFLLVVTGIVFIVVLWTRNGSLGESPERALAPMDVEWAGDRGYATLADGRLVALAVEGEEVSLTTLASGLEYPRGLAIGPSDVYVVELGAVPCEPGQLRCKGEHVASDVQEGERELLATTAGRVVAFPLSDEGVGEPRTVLDGLPWVNTDHALNDLELGPDGALYLSVGNLDRLAWDDVTDSPTGPGTEWLGSVLRIDPGSGEATVFASGFRNVYGLAFDETGTLWGVDNDGRGRGTWRFEELLRIEEGLDFGFPDEGTVGPYSRRTGFATWIMPSGAGSSGLHAVEGGVISGGCGVVTWLHPRPTGGDARLETSPWSGCVTGIAALDEDRVIMSTVLGDRPFAVTSLDALRSN